MLVQIEIVITFFRTEVLRTFRTFRTCCQEMCRGGGSGRLLSEPCHLVLVTLSFVMARILFAFAFCLGGVGSAGSRADPEGWLASPLSSCSISAWEWQIK